MRQNKTIINLKVFQVALVVKKPPASAGDVRDSGLIPQLGRCPGGRNDNPLQFGCLGNPMDKGDWWATVYRVTKTWTRHSSLACNKGTYSQNAINLHSHLLLKCVTLLHTTDDEFRLSLGLYCNAKQLKRHITNCSISSFSNRGIFKKQCKYIHQNFQHQNWLLKLKVLISTSDNTCYDFNPSRLYSNDQIDFKINVNFQSIWSWKDNRMG